MSMGPDSGSAENAKECLESNTESVYMHCSGR
jgi:hypothetical protein